MSQPAGKAGQGTGEPIARGRAFQGEVLAEQWHLELFGRRPAEPDK